MSQQFDSRPSAERSARASALDDVELVARISHGDFEAMAEIYERHSSHVHALATRVWGGDRTDQVVQDVFLQLWQSPRAFDPSRGSLAVHLSMQVRLNDPTVE